MPSPCPGVVGKRCGDRAALEDIEAERGVADRPRHHDAVAGFGAAAMDHLAHRHASERRDRDHQRARRRNGITAEQRTTEQRRVLAKSARERLKPRIIRIAQRQRQHKARRHGTLGGKIGEVHPQRLAGDGVGRILGQEMHAFDDGIRRHHDVVALRLQDRRIVDETERAGVGRERFEVARDQGVLGG
jgi:hypothetical protein